jgi:hypothetical protein
MGKKKHKIENVELIKVEKNYTTKEVKNFYNLSLQGIEETLLLVINESIDTDIVGKEIKYHLNEDGVISDFDLI